MEPSPALARLAQLIRVPTVSRSVVDDTDWAPFDRFRTVLAETYPAAQAALEWHAEGGRTLVARWPGRDERAEPVVLMAHYDVVDPGTAEWAHPPFEATVVDIGDDLELWGRGAIDDKGSLAAILESVDTLVTEGFTPAGDVWFVFGHDEETHGSGAAGASTWLRERGVRPRFVLDEGGAVVTAPLPGVEGRVAVVGVAEKGTLFVELSVDEPGGHASTPPPISAIGRLSRAIVRMDGQPFPASLNEPTRQMFRVLGTRVRGAVGWVYRNASVTGPVLLRALKRTSAESAAMIRTTRVATIFTAGHAENAIPEQARASVNLRVAVGSTIDESVTRLRSIINDPLVTVRVGHGSEPSPVSPFSGDGWDPIVAAIAQSHPDAVAAPYVQTGATDSRWFHEWVPRVYRFTPFDLSVAERGALHAVDERIRQSSFLDGITFYRALLRGL